MPSLLRQLGLRARQPVGSSVISGAQGHSGVTWSRRRTCRALFRGTGRALARHTPRIQRGNLGAVLLVLALCSAAPAAAQGTHFSTELQLGPWVQGGGGLGGSLDWGAGGKLPGSPLRMYLLLEAGVVQTERGQAYHQEQLRAYGALGGRALLPIAGPLRLHADALFGGAQVESTLYRPSGSALSQRKATPQWVFALGMQYRFVNRLSLGVRLQAHHSADPLADLRHRLGLSVSPWSYGITGGLVWHY